MSLPWIADKDINIFTNEYNQSLAVNRALSRLLDNDIDIAAKVNALITAILNDTLASSPISGGI
jgi:hypothetical protein